MDPASDDLGSQTTEVTEALTLAASTEVAEALTLAASTEHKEVDSSTMEETALPAEGETALPAEGEGEAALPTETVRLVFQDERHNSRTLQALNTMRKNKHFCDVILHVGNTELHAHRAVLASVSPHLFEVFTADDETKGNGRENVITYKLNGGFDRSALEKLVDYAYTSRLEVSNSNVQAVYLAAWHFKMDRVVKECVRHFVKQLSVDNCIETRLLPGIANNKIFVEKVDAFIAREFASICKSQVLLSLPCVRIEVLNQTRQEMSLVVGPSICQLILDWVHRQCEEKAFNKDQLTSKTHLLYLALDNSLQDCCELPPGDVSDTEIVQDYKKMSKKGQTNPKSRRKGQMQPAKPRVLIYSRDISEHSEQHETDWNLIAAERVGEHSFLALVTIAGRPATLSVLLRLNQPSTPSPVSTPVTSRPASEEKPDLYCAVANMSSNKCAVGCANLNNTLLVCGGYDRAECLKCVEAYDPTLNIWVRLASMKEARGRFSVAVVNGQAYAVAGSNGTTELATVERFDPQLGKWCRVTSLPLARCNTGLCELGGKIYCVGGWSGQAGIKQCDVLDPETALWTSIAPLQTGRYQAGVCSMNGRVFAVGGCDAWNCLSSVEVYDPVSDEWTFAQSLITARRGCGLAVFKGKVYAVGGSDGSHSLSCTEVYDPEAQTWGPGPSMTTSRANVGVAVIGSRLYAVGGFSGKTFLNSIEYLDERTNEWTTFVPKVVSMSDASLASLSSQSEEEDEVNQGRGQFSLANRTFKQVEEALQHFQASQAKRQGDIILSCDPISDAAKLNWRNAERLNGVNGCEADLKGEIIRDTKSRSRSFEAEMNQQNGGGAGGEEDEGGVKSSHTEVLDERLSTSS